MHKTNDKYYCSAAAAAPLRLIAWQIRTFFFYHYYFVAQKMTENFWRLNTRKKTLFS